MPAPTAQYPEDEEALEEALDALLDNPDFLDLVADEIMFQVREDCCCVACGS